MKKNIYRSENVLVTFVDAQNELEFEIRFSTSHARGRCDALCPRCSNPVAPSRWEIEGPDSLGNTVWFACEETLNGAEPCRGELRWTRRVDFSDGWVEHDD